MTQFVLYYDILILRDQLHVCVNVLVFINLVDLTYLRNDLFFGTQCLLLYLRRRNGFLNKKKDQVNMTSWSNCELPSCFLLRLSRLSVHANIMISVKYSSFYLLYNLIHLSAILRFCRIYVRLKITKEQKTCFKTFDKGRRWEHFMLRVRGLILASGRDYDKHDA